MSTTTQAIEVDGDKLMQFVFRAVDEVGATLNAALVVMGDRLGLYRALAGTDGLSPSELATRTGTAERYVREWLNAQAAGGYVHYDPDSGHYTLPPEQAVALTVEDSPAYLPGFFQIALGSVIDSPTIVDRVRTGAGFGWHEHVHDVHEGCERFFRPGYNAHLTSEWLPALDGVVEKLERGALVADVGCGHGVLDDPDGAGVPEFDLRRLGLPRRLDRDRARTGTGGGRRRSGPLRSGPRRHVQWERVSPRDDVRLPARHGRSGRCRAPRALDARAGRHLDDRRAQRGRPDRGQPQPGRARVLRVLDVALHARVALPGGRACARGAGRRGADPRRRRGRRARPASVAPRRRRSTSYSRRGRRWKRRVAGRAVPATRTARASSPGARSTSTGRAMATTVRRSCSCRPGRSSTRAFGRCSSRSSRAATGC